MASGLFKFTVAVFSRSVQFETNKSITNVLLSNQFCAEVELEILKVLLIPDPIATSGVWGEK